MLEFLAPLAAAVAAVIPERVKEFLVWWLQTPDGSRTFLLPWAVQFVFSWVGFSWFAWADYKNYKLKRLETQKLATRHPLDPFWASQLQMVPLVLYNQLVIWPLVQCLVVWPIYARTHVPVWERSWAELAGLVAVMPLLMIVSDFIWYWCHRLLHTKPFWSWAHRDHHVAPQSAISATFVHPLEYTMFSVAVVLPFALVGFPVHILLVPIGWGMITGGGAHSGYGSTDEEFGKLGNADEHNAHHLYHTVNFGMLMVADRIFGTYLHPAKDAREPPKWEEADRIASLFPKVEYGKDTAADEKKAN